MDISAGTVRRDTRNFRQRRKDQIRTDGNVHGNPEKEDQRGRHERSPAHTREPNDQTHNQANYGV